MLSLYDISVPSFIRGLRAMDAFLVKGAAWFAEQGRPESELTTARLYEDMAPLTGQIQRASDRPSLPRMWMSRMARSGTPLLHGQGAVFWFSLPSST